jgi:hypothetical protein
VLRHDAFVAELTGVLEDGGVVSRDANSIDSNIGRSSSQAWQGLDITHVHEVRSVSCASWSIETPIETDFNPVGAR